MKQASQQQVDRQTLISQILSLLLCIAGNTALLCGGAPGVRIQDSMREFVLGFRLTTVRSHSADVLRTCRPS